MNAAEWQLATDLLQGAAISALAFGLGYCVHKLHDLAMQALGAAQTAKSRDAALHAHVASLEGRIRILTRQVEHTQAMLERAHVQSFELQEVQDILHGREEEEEEKDDFEEAN